MSTGKIRFSAFVDFDGDCTLTVEIEGLGLHTHSSFWGNNDALVRFGAELIEFPKTAEHRVRFEEGKPEYQHYNYLLLEAYCYSPAGHSAVKVLVYNGEPEPYRQRVEFNILAEAASINRLGNMLRNWKIDEKSLVEWEPHT